jgi:hypothetical protein
MMRVNESLVWRGPLLAEAMSTKVIFSLLVPSVYRLLLYLRLFFASVASTPLLSLTLVFHLHKGPWYSCVVFRFLPFGRGLLKLELELEPGQSLSNRRSQYSTE